MPQHLGSLSKRQFKEYLSSFDDVLCDCDGVIYILFKPIDGAKDAVQKLKKLGKRIRYVSNNCTAATETFRQRLCGLGFDANIEDVILPTNAIITYLQSISFDKKIYLIGMSQMKSEFIEAGFVLANYDPTGDVAESLESIVSHIQDDLDVGAVVVDFDINVNYLRIQKALTYAKRPEVLLITGGADIAIPIAKNTTVMGPGYFQKNLEDMTTRKPMKFGKPGKCLNDYVNQRFTLNPERTLFIGDSISDMIFASDGGYQKLMVLSGITKLEDIESYANRKVLPQYYANSLKDLGNLIEQMEGHDID